MLDLDAIKAKLLRPSSASLDAVELLALVEECRQLRDALAAPPAPAHVDLPAAAHGPISDAAPTPPAAPAAKRKAHK